MSTILKGIILCTISGISFGGQWPVAGRALTAIDPFYFTFIRYLIVSVLLVVLLVSTEGLGKLKFDGKFFQLWFYGTMAFSVYNFLVFTGQKMLNAEGAIIGSILMALIPTVAVIMSWIFTNTKPNIITIISVLLAFLGVFLVINKGTLTFTMFKTEQILPIALMLLSVIAWVIYTIGGSKFQDWSSLRYTTLSCLLGNVSSIIVIFIFTKTSFISMPNLELILSLKWEFFYMSVIAGVIGVYTWNFGNLLLKPINGSLFINLVPVVTFIIAAFNGYKFSFIELLGALMVIASLFINNIHQRYLQRKTNLSVVNDKEEAII